MIGFIILLVYVAIFVLSFLAVRFLVQKSTGSLTSLKTVTFGDETDDIRLEFAGGKRLQRCVDVGFGDNSGEPDPHVEGSEHVARGNSPDALEYVEDVGYFPPRPFDDRAVTFRQNANDIAGETAARDVGKTVGSHPCKHVHDRRGVHDAGIEEHLSSWFGGVGEGAVERQILGHDCPHQGEAVGTEIWAQHTDNDVAGFDVFGIDFFAHLDDT